MKNIADNLKQVSARIKTSAQKCGRDASSVKLVAVSKTNSTDAIRKAFESGQRMFGENYAQEFASKAKELSQLDIEWHFIGHLQKNKAKLVAPIATWIESVDSIELADVLNRRAAREIKCLIEVNIGDETSKSGIIASEVASLARHMSTLQHLKLEGLMIIPPYDEDPEKSRPYFRRLKQLLSELNSELKLAKPLTELSMGMSHDFEVAIEEGATIVRVGTAIFGDRNQKNYDL